MTSEKKIVSAELFDTTSRDGTQTPRITSWTIEQHVAHAISCEMAGVKKIEGGFAHSSQNIRDQLRAIADGTKEAKIYSLAMATKESIDHAYDCLKHIGKRGAIHTFYATSPDHREFKYNGVSESEAIAKIYHAVKYASEKFETVMFSPEDATNTPIKYLIQVINVVKNAGGKIINIPDTLGCADPDEIKYMMSTLTKRFPDLQFSFHGHNDLGLANANSLAAVRANESEHPMIIQGTFGGIGERAGNTALEEFAIACRKKNIPIAFQTESITDIVTTVFDNSGLLIPINKPLVGANAYAHGSGIHAAAVKKNSKLYNAVPPELIGAKPVETILCEQSGGGILFPKMAELGIEVDESSKERIFEEFKIMAIGRPQVYSNELFLLTSEKEYRSSINPRETKLIINEGNVLGEIEIIDPQGNSVKESVNAKGSIKAGCIAINKIRGINFDINPDQFNIQSEGSGDNQNAVVYIEICVDGILVSGYAKHYDTIFASLNAYLECVDKIIAIKQIKNPNVENEDKRQHINASF